MKQSQSTHKVFSTVGLAAREGRTTFNAPLGFKPMSVGLSNGKIMLTYSCPVSQWADTFAPQPVLIVSGETRVCVKDVYVGSVYLPNAKTLHVLLLADK